MNQAEEVSHEPTKSVTSEWSELIQRQALSGLCQRDFCEAEGLAASTFTYWKRKLGAPVVQRGAKRDQPLFTPIQALPASAETSVRDEIVRIGWAIDLDLGDGLRLSIRKVA